MKATKQQLINLRTAMQHSNNDTFNRNDSPAWENRLINDWSKLHDKLGGMDFEGIDGDTLDDLWKSSWGDWHEPKLPECQYSHDMTYIEKVLELLGKE